MAKQAGAKHVTGMMIDFIGKGFVRTGVFKEYLNVLERLSRKGMILSIHSADHAKKHLSCDLKDFRKNIRATVFGMIIFT